MPAGRAANSLRTLVEDPRIMIAPGNGVHSTGRLIYNRRRVAADNSLRTLAEKLHILIAPGDGVRSGFRSDDKALHFSRCAAAENFI